MTYVPGSKRKYRRRPYGCRCDYCTRARSLDRDPNRTRRERAAMSYEEKANR